MHSSRPIFRQIVVVDGRPGDYAQVLSAGAQPGVVFNFAMSAEDALRIGVGPHATWLVNMELPDMPGHELAQLVLGRMADGAVFLVADQYDPADEIAALQHPRIFYGCKPPDESWLSLQSYSQRGHPPPLTTLTANTHRPLVQKERNRGTNIQKPQRPSDAFRERRTGEDSYAAF